MVNGWLVGTVGWAGSPCLAGQLWPTHRLTDLDGDEVDGQVAADERQDEHAEGHAHNGAGQIDDPAAAGEQNSSGGALNRIAWQGKVSAAIGAGQFKARLWQERNKEGLAAKSVTGAWRAAEM